MANCARIGGSVYNDPILNKLEEQAMAANPDLQAAAERFVQARDVMMRARSQRIPQIGLGGKVSDSRHHIDTLARDPDIPITGPGWSAGGIASWEPDFWSAIRNATRVETLPRRGARLRLGSRPPQPAGRNCV